MNQTNNTQLRSLAAVAISVAMVTSLSGCFLTAKSSDPVGAQTYGQQGPGTVGIRNVNSLFLSMTTITNLSPLTMVPNLSGGTQSLATTYSNIAPFISANGNIAGVNSAMLLSITGFAGSVCQAWLANEAAAEASKAGSSMANGGVNFGQGPNSITSQMATTLASNYASLFWGRAPTTAELDILLQAISGAQSAVTAGGTTGTEQVLLVPCTAVLASPAFLAT